MKNKSSNASATVPTTVSNLSNTQTINTMTQKKTTVREKVRMFNLWNLEKQDALSFDIDTMLGDTQLKTMCQKQGKATDRLVLSKEKEHNIILQAQLGDVHAKELLLQSLLNYLEKTTAYAARFLGNTKAVDEQDLFAEACKGALELLPKFDASRNCRYVTFLDTHLTYYLQQRLCEWRKNEDIEVEYEDFYRKNEYGEMEEIEHAYIDEMAHGNIAEQKALYDALCQLPEREREVIEGLYFRSCKLRELAVEYHVSTNRIHQIKCSAIQHLYFLLKPLLCA